MIVRHNVMARSTPLLIKGRRILLVLALSLSSGCASRAEQSVRNSDVWGSADKQAVLSAVETQSALMSLSDSVIFSVADVCNRVDSHTTRPDARLRLASKRLGVAIGAIAAATSPNAYVGFVDLLTLVTLHRISLEEPWAIEMFGDADRVALYDTFAAQEELVWEHAGRILTPRQQDDLRQMIVDWRKANPDQSDLASVRLQEFAAVRGVRLSGPKAEEAASIFGLLMIDPLANLAPAIRELKEARQFTERLAYWAKRLPVVLGWQVELTAARLLDSNEARLILQNSSQITQAASNFSASTDRVAESYERMLNEFPKERSAAIEQVDRAAAAQMTSLIDQSSAALTAERTAAIEQLGHTSSEALRTTIGRLGEEFQMQSNQSLDHASRIIAAERAQILADIDATSQRVVDRMALRLFVVIVLGALAVACISFIYRLITARFAAARATP